MITKRVEVVVASACARGNWRGHTKTHEKEDSKNRNGRDSHQGGACTSPALGT